MNTEMLTLEQVANIMRENKPYLIKVEEKVQKTAYGEIEIKLCVRAGVVEKMSFIASETWLKDKAKT